ncbi:ribosome-binding protein 1b isoform X2 [Epinephelus fuscoguttatus]|uniref:ribosome-binding protein 1b isoform X2 n=1 Tax=Epinephelus fuscoguttatus TaxID=293821 RepID=UPI0020D091A6|nr:ribosome-binding protein 1b isoform X2 [Epinephelus fuscoguttatus]
MDVSDPQTLGFMVFGGFMFISAVGIALVSTLSMKETSYEEALAKQRQKLVQTQTQRAEKKKKEKTLEKKNKAKKKEERPDGKLSEPGSDGGEEPEVVACTEPQSDPEPATEPMAAPEMPEPEPEPEPEPAAVTAATIESRPASSPKEKKKKKSAKVEPAAVLETVNKEVLVMAMAPVVDIPPVNVVSEVTREPSAAKTEEPKESSSKKKKSKTKPEPVTDSAGSSLLLPYSKLLFAVSNMALSDDELHKLMEVLNQRANVRHDSWQLACQKGDPLSTLKKQLEEKEKLLTTEQEDAATAKSRLRELSKELSAEKSKMASLDASLKAELSARVQEVDTMRARMEAAHQEHLKHTQRLNQKIGSLQEQLENGPNAQLARLQQENSILRDALNQATSQAESRQNAELARLRQDCVRLGRELTERTDALRADEERRKSLEAKMAAAEQELAQVQLVREDTERALKQHLEEVRLELKASQQEAAAVSELKGALASELQELKVQLENQAAVQAERSSEVQQLKNCVQRRDEQVVSLEAELDRLRAELQLLTSTQSQRAEEDANEAAAGDQTQRDSSGSETESEQPFESLEKDSELLRLEEELQQLREELQQARNHGNELQDKMAAFSTAERQSEQREAELKAALTEAESKFAALCLDFQASLQVLFPGVSVEAEQSDWLQRFTQKVEESKSVAESAHSELQSRLTEADRKQSELQTRFDQNTKVLQETEAELQLLQRRSEEEETVWKKKLSEAEQQKQTVLDQLQLLQDEVRSQRTETDNTQQLKEQLMLLEAQLEKQLEEASFTQSCCEELAQVQSQVQQMSVRLQVEQEQRQQLEKQLQQAQQEVMELQQRVEADQELKEELKVEAVQVKEETPV